MKNPADFPVLLESFFTQRLIAQRRASPHTIVSYRDTFRLLLHFAQSLHKAPSRLAMKDLNAPFLRDVPKRLGESPREWRTEPESASYGDSFFATRHWKSLTTAL